MNSTSVKDFEKLVKNKFNVYNSLFLNLPYPNVNNVGILIPILNNACKKGLELQKSPLETLDGFFKHHTSLQKEEDKIDFMFRVIQYVERQVVLYDSVEDAAFSKIVELEHQLSIKDYINLSDNSIQRDAVLAKLSDFSARIVFTAHPTQFYPPSVLNIIDRLRTLITRNDINEIDITLQQLGLTSLMNRKKPTPFDEAINIIYFLRHVYYDALPELYQTIKHSIRDDHFDNTDILQLGFWPGGDRDGNPFVTSAITRDVADALRMNLMQCYHEDLKKLEQKLTFTRVEEAVQLLIAKLYSASYDANVLIDSEEILDPLIHIRKELESHYNGIYAGELENLIDKVRIFRTHFAILDIRQNHGVHLQAIESVLSREKLIESSVEELEREKLNDILLHAQLEVHPDQFEDELLKDTIVTMAQLGDIQSRNGEVGCNRYIISNSEDIDSVLFVYGLLRWTCWKEGEMPMDIVPLFESMDAMDNASSIMKSLFEIPAYREHLRQRGDTQTVMLGFSDGTKDGGYLQANWSILKTKEQLSELFDAYGIRAIFFDGRGGPPARGGGKTHRFYASQTEKIANHAIQLTIQGQTISSRFGTKEHFTYNCEQLLTAGFSHKLAEKANTISESSRQLIEELARISFEKYTSLKEHEKFIPYLERKSTLQYYSQAKIGSRPSKRGNKAQLELKDLRAISFVGSWSQLKQNVPGYFGLGTAIQSLVQEGKLEALQALFKEVPFFRALIQNSMMSLSKCNFDLTRYIAEDPEFSDFWKLLLSEFELSIEMTLLISGYSKLMEEEPVTRSSVEIREQIVLPLLVIQQYALQMIDKQSDFTEAYRKMVKRSLYGNINASRNSA